MSPSSINQTIAQLVESEVVTHTSSPPLYCDNRPNPSAVQVLKDWLKEQGHEVRIKELPRSVLSIVSVPSLNLTMPIMPSHKAVCMIVMLLKGWP
jgi:hypothetical protein